MTHANAPLTPAGRHRLVTRVISEGRPVAHVAAEAGVARSTLTKWVHRYQTGGPQALEDRSSAPATRPTRLPVEVIELIDTWRRQKKWSARRITHELAIHGHTCAVRTVSRWLHRLGISRRKDLDPIGENNRAPATITAFFPGHMIHLDVKKLGRIPDGGGWWAHGRGSQQALASKRAHKQRVGYTYLHSAVDGFSRLAYTEALDDEKAATTIGFFCRARVFFTAHGITRIHRVVTDNGLLPRTGVLHRPRHHPHPPGSHRQRRELHRPGLHQGRGSTGQPAPADPALHAPAQREGRALQPATGR